MRFFIILLTCILCLSGLTPTLADEDTGKKRQKIYHVYADINLVPTVRFKYYKPRIMVKLVYPTLTTETENDYIDYFNQLVNDIMQEEIDDFKKQVLDNQPHQELLPKNKIRNRLTIDFNTAIINIKSNPLVSIRFNIQGFITGMAHPYHKHRVLNYALDYGEEVLLSDLFRPEADYLQVLSDYSREILLKKFKDSSMVMQGTAPTPENFRNWSFNPYGLLITFDEYQVAPYVYGTQTVLVPYSVLRDVVSPESFIDVCIKHKYKCSRGSLLTGGFIDTAINTRHRGFDPMLRRS